MYINTNYLFSIIFLLTKLHHCKVEKEKRTIIDERARDQMYYDEVMDATLKQRYHEHRMNEDRHWMRETDYLVRGH